MSLAVVTLKKGEGRFLKSGGLWVYDNEIATIMGSFVNGDIVLVHDFDGYPMGRGFINTNSKIAVRMLTRDEHREINEDFLRQRVRDAWEYRKKVVDTGSCRVIFGEADFLPGLVVDKFSDVLVVHKKSLRGISSIDHFNRKIHFTDQTLLFVDSFFILFFGVDIWIVVVNGDIKILGEIFHDIAATWRTATVE